MHKFIDRRRLRNPTLHHHAHAVQKHTGDWQFEFPGDGFTLEQLASVPSPSLMIPAELPLNGQYAACGASCSEHRHVMKHSESDSRLSPRAVEQIGWASTRSHEASTNPCARFAGCLSACC